MLLYLVAFVLISKKHLSRYTSGVTIGSCLFATECDIDCEATFLLDIDYKGQFVFDAITIDNVYASKAIRYADRYPYANAPRIYPLIWIQDGVIVKNLDIRSVHRREKNVPIELLYIGKCFKPIERITVSDMTAENETDKPIPMIVNAGHVKHLRLCGLDADRDEVFVNNGTVDELIQN